MSLYKSFLSHLLRELAVAMIMSFRLKRLVAIYSVYLAWKSFKFSDSLYFFVILAEMVALRWLHVKYKHRKLPYKAEGVVGVILDYFMLSSCGPSIQQTGVQLRHARVYCIGLCYGND